MRILLSLVVFIVASSTYAQLSKTNYTALQKSEDTLKRHARQMIQSMDAEDRFNADSIFIRSLVKSLRTPFSFYFPFDSVETVSRIYAPDSTFRIFSWQFTKDDNTFRQRGAIQMRTEDGSLKLFPLIDMSDFTDHPEDSVRTPQNWVGAIYYGIIMKEHNNKKYYTLLGFDDNSVRSTKKWIEVLTFNNEGKPVFGGPFFSRVNDSLRTTKTSPRFSIEYKKVGRARLNYDRELDMIVFDHLISEDNEPDKKFTLVPDGDYEGFKWDKGQWVFVEKVFDFKLKDGEAPVPEPLKDDVGNSNEDKLLKQSQKNGYKLPADGKTATPKKVNKKSSLDRQPKQLEEY